MPTPARALAAPTLLLALALAGPGGCGGGDEPAPESTTTSRGPMMPMDAARAEAVREASASGGGGAPSRPAAGSGGAAPAERDPSPTVAAFVGYRAPKPATWQWQPATRMFRAANWVVPGRDGSTQAELVVFDGIGGSNQMNIDRWIGQFRASEEGPLAPRIEEGTVNGWPVTWVEIAGAHRPMGAPSHIPDQLFLAAIVETPTAVLHVRLNGPAATVEPERAAFRAFVEGMRPAGDEE